MKIEISTLSFLAETAARFAKRSSTLAVLETVQVQADGNMLTLSATDLDTHFKISKPSDLVLPLVAVNAKTLLSFLKVLKSKVTVEIKVEAGKLWLNQHNIVGFPEDEVPPEINTAWLDPRGNNTMTLADAVKYSGKVKWCISDDEARPTLMNMHLEHGDDTYQFVATNGFTIGMAGTGVGIAKESIVNEHVIPARMIDEMARLVKIGPTMVRFDSFAEPEKDNKPRDPQYVSYSYTRITGKAENGITWQMTTGIDVGNAGFPPYRAIIPKQYEYEVDIASAPWQEAATAALELFKSDPDAPALAKMSTVFNSTQAHFFYLGTKMVYHETIETQSPAPVLPLIVTVNPQFVRDSLVAGKSETVHFCICKYQGSKPLDYVWATNMATIMKFSDCEFVIMPIGIDGDTVKDILDLIEYHQEQKDATETAN